MDFIWKYDSPLGGITLASDGSALAGLWFDGQRFFASSLLQATFSAPSDFEGLLAAGYLEKSLSVFDQTCRWLDIYFSGKEPGFTPPLALRGTPFRMAVWEELPRIPFGRTATYGEIAFCLAGHPSARAVGSAVGHNPISLIVPCHRVVGAAGRRAGESVGPTMVGPLTGYAGGLDRKLRLLELEGVIL